MVVAECFFQISRLYCLVDKLSSLKIGLRLEHGDDKLKDSERIERFEVFNELATLDQLDAKNAIHQRQQKNMLHYDDIERVIAPGLRSLKKQNPKPRDELRFICEKLVQFTLRS